MYAVLGKKSLRIILFVIALTAVFVLEAIIIGDSSDYSINSNAGRIKFLSRLGLEVDDTTGQVAEVVIPEEFNDVYENYNKIQKQAGYDLSEYSGKTVVKYTYEVKNYDGDDTVLVNILTYGNKVIGGDVCSTAVDGFMKPLSREGVSELA